MPPERVFIPQSMEVAPLVMIDVDVLASRLFRVGGGGGGGWSCVLYQLQAKLYLLLFLVLVQFSGRYMSLQGVTRPQVSLLEGGEETLGLHWFFSQATSDTGFLSVINHWRWTVPSLDGTCSLFLVCVGLQIVSAPTAGHFSIQRHRVCM